MNPYENAGGYTQPQPRHNAQQHQQQHQQQQYQQQNQYQQQQGTQYTSNRYNPNAYQQPAQNQNQYQQQQQQPRNHMTSPPPLQHPVPTHPPVQMRDPAPTPSPRMNYAQAQQGQGQYQQNQYRPQQAGGGGGAQQRSSFERSSFDQQQQQQGGGYGGSPRNQFMSPQQHHQTPQHQQQHHQQQQQQQQPGLPAFPFNFNDGTTQLGMQFGRSAMTAGQEYVEANLNRWVNRAALQPYFNVSNSYVVNKLKLLVFPWRHKLWTRLLKRSETTGETIGYLSPRDDINAPDMYIPVMAFVTYVLLVALSAGVASGDKVSKDANKFSPEMLGPTASSALAVIFLEFIIIKLCVYVLNITSDVPILDLLAYSGYKFVGIIVSIIVQLSKAPKSVFWSVFLYTGAATGFFL
ncbi:hypothetical protein BGZ95_009465, partial [Linnemannia exigua]